MVANTPQSRKAKGASLQKYVKGKILEAFPDLEDDDVLSRSMGAGGTDIHLSPKAQKYFSFSVECKNTEKMKLWQSWEQCTANAELTPLLIAKRNRSDVLAVVRLDDLLEIIKENNK